MTQKPNENAVVAKIGRALARGKPNALALGLGDDAALWKPSRGCETVLTCDWFLEDSHFLRHKHPPDSVGWKCLARAVSDVAAMGGMPRCFLLSLALPEELAGAWLSKFLRGLKRASRSLGCEPAGGDTTRQDHVLISLTIIGEIAPGRAVLRSAARAGDLVYVSGILGEADLGLRQLRNSPVPVRSTNAAIRKHLYPEPRLTLGKWLAENRLATAMMDLSDGLSTDLPRLCSASHVGALIDSSALPVTSLLPLAEAREFALHGGDDYELLFTVSARNAARLPRRFRGVPLSCIGRITREKKILVAGESGTKLLRPGGWDPFR